MKFMPLSNFYLIFKLIFYEFFLFKMAKRGLLTFRLTWRAEADVARGTASRCDAALNHVAEPGWPARGAGGAGADGSTWGPMWGATWQAGR